MTDIEAFLAAETFAVAGASNNRAKFGNRVFRALLASGRSVTPIHPTEQQVEEHAAAVSVSEIATAPQALSIVTPPTVTETIVREAIAAGVSHVWMQPGAESPDAMDAARQAGLTVIAGGPCVLVELAR